MGDKEAPAQATPEAGPAQPSQPPPQGMFGGASEPAAKAMEALALAGKGGPKGKAEELRLVSISGPSSKYVKLNVGGSLHFTTIGTLTKQDSMLAAMFSGRMEVLSDAEGWVLIDRCGKWFPTILNYLRDGTVGLPGGRREVLELSAEAKYYCVTGLVELCQRWVEASEAAAEEGRVHRIPIISTAREERLLLAQTHRPLVKLLLNRHNNKYSYTHQSDDHLLRNLELFDKLALRFSERVLFIKDVGAANEVCSWTFVANGRKMAEVCCTSIVYATDKKHTKVEFPEARIYEEAMNILLHEPLCPSCQVSSGAGTSSAGASPRPSAPDSPCHEDEDRAHEKIQKARAGIRSSQ